MLEVFRDSEDFASSILYADPSPLLRHLSVSPTSGHLALRPDDTVTECEGPQSLATTFASPRNVC
jgi:hypothetical protein